MRFYQRKVLEFWREQPGEGEAGRAGRPDALEPGRRGSRSRHARAGLRARPAPSFEPVFILALYVLALVGLARLPRRYLALTLLLLGYGTRDGDGVRRHRSLPRAVGLPPLHPGGRGARGAAVRGGRTRRSRSGDA